MESREPDRWHGLVASFPGVGGNSVKLTDTSTANPVTISKWVDAPSGVQTLEFDIQPAQTGDFIAAGYLLDSAGLRSVRVYFNYTTAEIQVYNGTTSKWCRLTRPTPGIT